MAKTPLSRYDYPLPDELIAQTPTSRRDASRLMRLDRSTGQVSDHRFSDITDHLDHRHVLVVNDTKVLKARLFATKKTGGNVEVFLLAPVDDTRFTALTRGKVRPGMELQVGDVLVIVEKILDDGVRLIRFENADPYDVMRRYGSLPLPPYIRRDADDTDEERYQTVYAEAAGSVAAPTAGLHFTPDIMNALEEKGVEIVRLTLHVGIGTFRPISSEYIEDHQMHFERYTVPPVAAERLNNARSNGKRIVAVGTTSVRTLESIVSPDGHFAHGSGSTDVYIRPGQEFRAVDGMVTNFHLPKSSLLVLVSAFAGFDAVMNAYAHAVAERYRFFSYGDAMLII